MFYMMTARYRRLARVFIMSVLSLLMVDCFLVQAVYAGQNWPSFRGPSAAGVMEGYPVPVKWDLERLENIRWKVPIPCLGHSCPIVWDDRVFITTAVKDKGEPSLKVGLYGDVKSAEDKNTFSWHLYCIDRKKGDVLWSRQSHRGKPKVRRHPKSSHANATPCTNGRYVVAFFGSEGMYCYDMDGNLVWEKGLGKLDWGYFRMPAAQRGGGSSPIIHKQMVIIQCDVQKNSFIAAFNLKGGGYKRQAIKVREEECPGFSVTLLTSIPMKIAGLSAIIFAAEAGV